MEALMERPKMELPVNQATKIKLLFDDCAEGNSKFGKYFLYAVVNGDGNSEYSLFAPELLHDQLKKFKKGDELLVTKLAAQRGTKLVVAYDVVKQEKQPEETIATRNSEDDFLYSAMEKSLEQSISLAKKFNSVPIDKLAISLFIARTKGNLSFSN